MLCCCCRFYFETNPNSTNAIPVNDKIHCKITWTRLHTHKQAHTPPLQLTNTPASHRPQCAYAYLNVKSNSNPNCLGFHLNYSEIYSYIMVHIVIVKATTERLCIVYRANFFLCLIGKKKITKKWSKAKCVQSKTYFVTVTVSSRKLSFLNCHCLKIDSVDCILYYSKFEKHLTLVWLGIPLKIYIKSKIKLKTSLRG